MEQTQTQTLTPRVIFMADWADAHQAQRPPQGGAHARARGQQHQVCRAVIHLFVFFKIKVSILSSFFFFLLCRHSRRVFSLSSFLFSLVPSPSSCLFFVFFFNFGTGWLTLPSSFPTHVLSLELGLGLELG